MCNLHVVGHMFAWLHISLFLTGNNFMELHKREWRSLSRPSPYQAFFISYSLLPPLDGSYMFQKERSYFHFFSFFVYVFGGLDCVGHFFAYVLLIIFLRNVWIGTQRAAGASRRSTNLTMHPPNLAIHFGWSFCGTKKDHNSSFPVDRYFFFGT